MMPVNAQNILNPEDLHIYRKWPPFDKSFHPKPNYNIVVTKAPPSMGNKMLKWNRNET
jgi:hypothetical protein